MASRNESPDRTTVYEWNNPRHDNLHEYRWFNPILWLLFLQEVGIHIRWYLWHKRQSWRARRVSMHTGVVFSLQNCEMLLNDDDLTRQQRRNVERIQRQVEYMADELNLQSDKLDRYRDDGKEADDA